MKFKCFGCDLTEETAILQIAFFDGAAEQWACESCAISLDHSSGVNGRMDLSYQIYRHKHQVLYRGPKSAEYNYMLEG